MLIDEKGVEALDEPQCDALLARCAIGRIAITSGALPVILPVRFAVHQGDILFATGEGSKLRSACRNAVVAFEVDGVDPIGCCGWSVLVVGTANEATDDTSRTWADRNGVRAWTEGQAEHLVRLRREFVMGRRMRVQPADATHPVWA